MEEIMLFFGVKIIDEDEIEIKKISEEAYDNAIELAETPQKRVISDMRIEADTFEAVWLDGTSEYNYIAKSDLESVFFVSWLVHYTELVFDRKIAIVKAPRYVLRKIVKDKDIKENKIGGFILSELFKSLRSQHRLFAMARMCCY